MKFPDPNPAEPRRALSRALGVLLCLLLLAPLVAIAAPLASGDERGAWLLSPGSRGSILFFIPAGSDDARAHAVTALPALPIAIASDADQAFLLFPRRDSSTPGIQVYPARLITRDPGASPRPEFRRAEILAPLPDGAEILQIALADSKPLVLRKSVAPSGPTLTIQVQQANAWAPIALPDDADHNAPTWLRTIAGRPVLAQQSDPQSLRLWTLASLDPGPPVQWTGQTIPTAEPIDELISTPTGLRAIVRRPGAIEVLAIHAGRLEPDHTIAIDRDDPALAPCGSALLLAWPDTEADSGLYVRLLSDQGEPLYDGPLNVVGPVSPTELQILTVLLSSVFLTAIVFMLRPGMRPQSVVNFPPNTSIASPGRRLAAFLIDLAPGALVAYLVWFPDARSASDVATVLAERGAMPILAVAAITIVLSTVGEATIGRTPGKAAMRCRTISCSGLRPTWGQALGRNVVKVLCPPIAMLVALSPASPYPGSFDTLVIVDHPPAGADGPDPPPRGPSDRP